MTDIGPGSVVEDRYRVVEVIPAGAGERYRGVSLRGGRDVGLVTVPPTVVHGLRRATLLSHAQLATLLEVIPRRAGYALAVFEEVSGRSLTDLLAQEPRLEPVRVAAIGAAIGDALAALHQRGAAHGLLHPGCVIVEPPNGSAAMLSYAPPSATADAFHCPERGASPPSPADDVWALAATLHVALLGAPPPAGGYSSRSSLERVGLEDRDLAGILANCLARRPEQRVTLVGPVRDALAAYRSAPLVTGAASPARRANSFAPPPRALGSLAPPRPPAEATASIVAAVAEELVPAEARVPVETRAGVEVAALPPTATSAPPRAARGAPGPWRWIAVAALLTGLIGIAWMATRGRSPLAPSAGGAAEPASAAAEPSSLPVGARASAAARPRVADASSAPAASAASSAEVSGASAVAARGLPSEDDLAACVTRLTPPGAFAEPPRLAFLCTMTDPRAAYQRMKGALVRGSKGRLTPAMTLWSRLHWYGMAGVALLRGACCGESPPFELPNTTGCEPTAPVLDEFVRTVAARGDLASVTARYTKSVTCHSFAGRSSHFGLDSPLGGGEAATFEELLGLWVAAR